MHERSTGIRHNPNARSDNSQGNLADLRIHISAHCEGVRDDIGQVVHNTCLRSSHRAAKKVRSQHVQQLVALAGCHRVRLIKYNILETCNERTDSINHIPGHVFPCSRTMLAARASAFSRIKRWSLGLRSDWRLALECRRITRTQRYTSAASGQMSCPMS